MTSNNDSAPPRTNDVATRLLCVLVGSTLIGTAGYVMAGADIKPSWVQALTAMGVGIACVRLAGPERRRQARSG